MIWQYRPYPWPRLAGFWDAAAVVDEAPTSAEQVPAEADRVWPFGDADVAVEACVLDDLAALTSVHGPWEAATLRFNPIDDVVASDGDAPGRPPASPLADFGADSAPV